jgi:uncharacterized protein (TIGR02001 family)
MGAHAEIHVEANLAVVSNSVYRGVKLIDHGAALQARVQARSDAGLYIGVWASRVDYPFDDRALEVDYFGGYHKRWSPHLAADITFLRYTYDKDVNGVSYDWGEIQLAIHLRDRWTFLAGVADDWIGRDERHQVIEGTYRHPLPHTFVAYASLGRQFTDRVIGEDYTYWEMGLTRVISGFDVSLEYSDIGGIEPRGPIADSQFAVSIARSFTFAR